MKKNFKKYLAGLISAIMIIGTLPMMSVSADYMNTSAMTELFTLNMNKTENSIVQNYVESVGRGATGTLKDSLVVKSTSNVSRVNRSETDKALAVSSPSGVLSIDIPEQPAKDSGNTTIISFDINLENVENTDYFGIGGNFWFEKDGVVEKKTVGDASYRKHFATIYGTRIRTKPGKYAGYGDFAFGAGKWHNVKLVLGYDSYSIYVDGTNVRSGSGISYSALTGDTADYGYKLLGIADKLTFTNIRGTNAIDNISVYSGKVVQSALTMDFTGYTGGKNVALSTAQFNSWTNTEVMTPATGVAGKPATDVSQKIEWSTTPQTTVLQFAATSSAKDMYICGEKWGGIHMVSKDGINFEPAKERKSYSRTVRFADGTEEVAFHLERPNMMIKDGKPFMMCFAYATASEEYIKNINNLHATIDDPDDDFAGMEMSKTLIIPLETE